MPDRAARRRLSRLFDRIGRQGIAQAVNRDLFMREANAESDETQPLDWTGGGDNFVHRGCGGKAEKSSHYAVGAYCHRCGRTVPWEEAVNA